MTQTNDSGAGPRRRWSKPRLVIAELDANGEIDDHAAMCLRFTIEDLVAYGAREIVIDLRDLVAINADAVALLTQADRTCRAAGARLGLLSDAGCCETTVAHVLLRSSLRARSQPAPQGPRQPPRRFRREHRNARVRQIGTGRK
jgi:anti-anti-sigma factor